MPQGPFEVTQQGVPTPVFGQNDGLHVPVPPVPPEPPAAMHPPPRSTPQGPLLETQQATPPPGLGQNAGLQVAEPPEPLEPPDPPAPLHCWVHALGSGLPHMQVRKHPAQLTHDGGTQLAVLPPVPPAPALPPAPVPPAPVPAVPALPPRPPEPPALESSPASSGR